MERFALGGSRIVGRRSLVITKLYASMRQDQILPALSLESHPQWWCALKSSVMITFLYLSRNCKRLKKG